MRHRAGCAPRAAVGCAAAFVLASAGGACGASEPTSTQAAAAETAEIVCTLLRDSNNEMGERMNATSDTITDDDDPATANEVLAEGFDELVTLAETHRAELDDLGLPQVPDREALLAELRAGADAALDRLEDEQDDIAALEPITVDRQAGALGGAFVALEGALSALEPRVGAYRAELREAFAADDGCEHVIQPTS